MFWTVVREKEAVKRGKLPIQSQSFTLPKPSRSVVAFVELKNRFQQALRF
jgi:hypothetical protein